MAMEEVEYAALFPRLRLSDETSSTESDLSKRSDESMILEEGEGVSVRSSEQSMMGEDDDDFEYDSSDDEFYLESDISEEEEEEEEDFDNQEFVEVLGYGGVPLTNEDIMGWIEPDERSYEEKWKLLPQIRRFLKSLYDNEGFDCSDYPGYISGLTRLMPGQHIIDQRERYPEGYNHLLYMGSLALKYYNEKCETEFRLEAVEKVMMSRTKGTIYYLTLNATSNLTSMTFQADVWEDTIDKQMEVAFCRPVAPPLSLVDEQLSHDNSTEENYKSMDEVSDKYTAVKEKTDLLTQILRLSVMSDSEILKLIENGKHTPKTDEDKFKLMTKVRKYLKSILQSEGFKCTNFPGRILGITTVIPRQKLIDQMNCFSVCYVHLLLMAKLALDSYLEKDENAELHLTSGLVQTANLWKETDCCYTYFITFAAGDLESGKYLIYEAQVQDRQSSIEVKSCRPARFM